MRIKALKILYILILVTISVRLFYWQVIKYEDLSVMAEGQHLNSQTIDGSRGQILASDQAILAANKPTYLLYATPKIIKNIPEVADKLSKIILDSKLANNEYQQIDMKDEDIYKKEILDLKTNIYEKLTQDLNWVALDNKVSLSAKKSIEDLHITGLGFQSQMTRFYPEASSAAHILGFVASDPLGQQKGYFGVEGFYNGELKGVGGVVTEEKDALGTPILMGTFQKKEPKSGRNLVLNIDRTVQYIVEKRLKAGVTKYSAKTGSVVVMDPKTGAILAMASYPNYDPNHYTDFAKEYFKNPSVADSYEPGSTFKVLVMAAAINEGLIKRDTKCDICSEPITISGFTIRTWNNKYYPDATMNDVIVHSDNTGMVYVGKKLGVGKLYDYIEKFGFGNLTGIDLQDETSPEIRDKSDWGEIDLATASFGQGIAATALQVVRAVGVIASGGNLMEPHIVRSVIEGDKVTEIKPKVVGTPISSEAAKTVTSMMVDAVAQGEAKVFAPKGYKIAGKTGTAQIPVAGHYDPNKTIASFVGFAPADDPKFVMIVRYEEPSSSIYGAETAAPTFFEIAKELLPYYNIVPTE